MPICIFALTFAAMHFLTKCNRFGTPVYAKGGNMAAARRSGTGTTAIDVKLHVIAAVIVGGTSLSGGKGPICGTPIGVLILGCISNGMTLLNVSEYWQYLLRGGIMLGTVLLN